MAEQTELDQESREVDYVIERDQDSLPIMFAVRAPGQVAAQRVGGAIVQRTVRSGNPQFDPTSGRFAGSGTTRAEQTPEVIIQATRTLPQGITEDQWENRLDVVRDLARQFVDELDDKTLRNFLRRRPSVQEIDVINIDALKKDVRAQQIDDYVDVLDGLMKSTIVLRKNVRLQAPRGWIKKITKRLSDEEILKVAKRLEGRGWGPRMIKKHVVGQVPEGERRTKLNQLYSETRPKRENK